MLVEDILFIICGCAVIETIIHYIHKPKEKKRQRKETTDEDMMRFIISKGWVLHRVSEYGVMYFTKNSSEYSKNLDEAYIAELQFSNYETIKEEVDVLKEKGIEL